MNIKHLLGELFEGRSGEMRTRSPWLASEDLQGLGDVVVQIASVHRHKDVEFEAGRKEPIVYTVAFENRQRQLVLNSTNRKTLVRKFGTDVKKWIGQSITLYVDENVRLKGQTVCGIRIR